jgi:uncharacterized protein (TIGR03437 family)
MYVKNYPVGLLVRVRDGIQSVEPVAQLVNGTIEPVPIDFGPSTDELFLVLFGTGLRKRSSLANVKAAIGGMDAPVEYAGPQGEFAGLDQVNIRLPRSLAAREAKIVELSLTVDGKIANGDADTLYLAFK